MSAGVRIHHVAYAVDDLDAAVLHAVETVGAGPFFAFRNIELTPVSRGEPALFEHSAAFGQWGSVVLEFMTIDRAGPEHVEAALVSATPTINHIGCVVASLDDESAELETRGFPAFLRAGIGDIEFVMHDARALLGHNLEVHQDSEGFRGFFSQVYEAAVDWDGRDPIRELNS
jgi:hypothetical protein